MRKRVRIVEGEPVIYQEHLVSGCPGPLPLGHHPILKLPDRERAGILDMSAPVAGFTTPQRIEEPANGGYSSLAGSYRARDDGRPDALSHAPGLDDLVCFVSNPRREFAFSAVSVPEEG